MWPFGPRNEYPYTDFHELNTDWILRKITDLDYKVKNWLNDVVPTIRDTVNTWLDDHPEATTTVQDGSITEAKLNDSFLPQVKNYYITPFDFGAVGDGIADDTQAIQDALDTEETVFFPPVTFRVTDSLKIRGNIKGMASPRMDGQGSIIKYDGVYTGDNYLLDISDISNDKGLCINGIALDCNAKICGINYTPDYRPPIKITDVSIWDFSIIGIRIAPQNTTSRCAMLNGISITGGLDASECGIYVSGDANDCSITDFVIMYCQKGIIANGGGLRLDQGHIYTGRSGIADINNYWAATICVSASADVIASNIYIDSGKIGWSQTNGIATISNLFAWYDNYASEVSTKASTVINASGTASIQVGTFTIGGNRDMITALFSNNVKIGNIELRGWGILPTVENTYPYGQLPYMLPNIGKGKYHFNSVSSNWTVVGVFYIGGDGISIMRISRGKYAGDIVCNVENGTPTFTAHAINSTTDVVPVKYSINDKYAYIWTELYTPVAVETIVATPATYNNNSLCPIDISAFPSWTNIETESSEGLNTITYS